MAPRPSSTQLPANSSAGCLRPNNEQQRTESHTSKKVIIIRLLKNVVEAKEQGKNLKDQINEEEIGNLPEKEFRELIVKMIHNLRNRREARTKKIQECLTRN